MAPERFGKVAVAGKAEINCDVDQIDIPIVQALEGSPQTQLVAISVQ